MPLIQGGVWPAMLTPVTEAGEQNLEILDKLVNTLIDEGLDGLYLLGSTGQGPTFSLEARKMIAERALRTARERIPIIVHVGCVATQDSVELARHAAQCGADGISAVPPIYYMTNADGVFAHYRAIGSATDLPFFPYHHTMFGEATLADPSYTDRLMEIPHIAGMKITVRDLFIFSLINERTGGKLQLFSGADELICHAAVSGSCGAIGTFYNLWGPACQRARQAMVDGEFEKARSFMAVFHGTLDRILNSGSPVGFVRAAMRLKYGVEIGPGRTPAYYTTSSWDEREVRQLMEQVEQAV